MAALRYRDEHNKVGYLQKPTGSDDYHQILDFLRASHIRSPELGPPAILATIDETPYTITKDLVRSQLQLADDGGICNISHFQLNFEGQPMPLLAAMLSQAQAGEVFEYESKPDPKTYVFLFTSHETDDEPFTSTNVEDEPLGGSFHASPSRSTQAPPAGHTSGGAGDLITLTALSSIVSTFVHKVNSLETELKAHKKLFKDVVAKLVKKVKAMDAVGLFDSNILTGGPSNDPAATVRLEALERERSEKEKAEIARQDAIYAKQLEQEIDIMAQVHANAGLSSELLGADVNDDNFAERMVALINQRKRAFAEQTAKKKRDKPMNLLKQREYMRLIAEFEKIRMAVADLKSQELKRTLKRAGEALEPDTSKKQKSTEAPIPSVLDVPQPPVVSSPKSSGTRRKSLGRSRITKPKSILTELDLDADDKTFIKVVFDEDSEDEAPILWSAFAGWEILHMVDRHDPLKLYGLVVKYYENHPVAGAGLVLEVGGYIPFNVHVLEEMFMKRCCSVCRCILYPPLSEAHGKSMLKHKPGDFKETSWIRRIRLIGYGVLSSSVTVYWGPLVRRIGLLGYGVLAKSVHFLIFDQSIIYDVYADVDTAYSSKSERTHRAPNRLCLNVEAKEHSVGDLNEPTSYKAAMLDSESHKWIDAMNAEIRSMIDNMKKTDMDGIVHTYNARLVAKGYTQLYGVDYEETFSPVTDIRAIRILISITAFYDYEIWQMDVKM
ncbi:putative ribonuclease H-like domain-containing protein [Tanacetum coccineum]